METIRLDNLTVARLARLRRLLEKPGEALDLPTVLMMALDTGLDTLGAPAGLEVAIPHGLPRCSVCERPDRSEIDACLAGGKSINLTAAWYGVSRGTLQRHVRHG